MIEWKHPELRAQFNSLHPKAKHIIYWQSGWVDANTNCKTIRITSIQRDGDEGAHGDYRAWDTSVVPFLEAHDDPNKLVEATEAEFGKEGLNWGAIGAKTGKQIVCMRHDVGQGDHIHNQIKKGLK